MLYLADVSSVLNALFACLIHGNQQIQPNSAAPDGFYQPLVWSKGEDPRSPPCFLSGCDLPLRSHLSPGGYREELSLHVGMLRHPTVQN